LLWRPIIRRVLFFGFGVIFPGFSMASLGICYTTRYSALALVHEEPRDGQFLRADIDPANKALENTLSLLFCASLAVVEFHEALLEHVFQLFLALILGLEVLKLLAQILDFSMCIVHPQLGNLIGFLRIPDICFLPVLYTFRMQAPATASSFVHRIVAQPGSSACGF